ncbi:MAG: hypothetical protein LC135_14180 [Phycisphaerae bacterium]|nr:hypothetical protein [Phycisphaerae bacterium]MCZ2400997.1 hypothetical protein [Phycisphaerae bacterium]NUQ49399.1 hypothetical protein [Phycisphaerae bacterium]
MHVHVLWIDWVVFCGYLLLTTLLGARLAGRTSTMRDFFLAGRKLPWYAVSGSIIATEISAVTFISVPAIVFAPGGDLTYLQLALGAVLARVIIGLWFVPAFYEREIYSPYDYVGNRLGPPARGVTTGLFVLGAILGQSVRVLLTALILEQISGIPLNASIWIIGAVAVGWTLLGGISLVVWTDLIQFVLFSGALVGALILVLVRVDGGWAGVAAAASTATDALGGPADKLRLWNLSADPNVAFTLWAALIGNTILCLNSYGTDQMIAQRMFCCRGPRAASLAIISSSLGLGVAVLAMLVGLGLYAFYQQHPLDPADAASVVEKPDRIFPHFIVREIPPGLTGLILAGVFAAAISSLDSVLAALSQTVIAGFVMPLRRRRRGFQVVVGSERSRDPASATGETAAAAREGTAAPNDNAKDAADGELVWLSKLLVVAWGVVLCLMASLAELARARYGDILNLALAMASYTGGAMLAAFLLALWRLNVDWRGIAWGAPLSVLAVFALSWHQPWAQWTTIALSAAVALTWLALRIAGRNAPRRPLTSLAQTVVLLLAAGLPVFLACYQRPDAEGTPGHLSVAWPWNVPLGFFVAFLVGYVLARPRPASPPPRNVA